MANGRIVKGRRARATKKTGDRMLNRERFRNIKHGDQRLFEVRALPEERQESIVGCRLGGGLWSSTSSAGTGTIGDVVKGLSRVEYGTFRKSHALSVVGRSEPSQ